MATADDTDRCVVPSACRGGWDVVKEDHWRASGIPTRLSRSRERRIVSNVGGEVRVASRFRARREAKRALKRHLSRQLYKTLVAIPLT